MWSYHVLRLSKAPGERALRSCQSRPYRECRGYAGCQCKQSWSCAARRESEFDDEFQYQKPGLAGVVTVSSSRQVPKLCSYWFWLSSRSVHQSFSLLFYVQLPLLPAEVASAYLIESNTHHSDRSGGGVDTLPPANGASAPAVSQMSSGARQVPRPLISASGLVCGALFIVGTCGYRYFERWDWLDCAYASVGVLTTVGIVMPPRTPSSRLLTSVLNVASLGVVSVWLSEISSARYNFTRRALGFGKIARSPSMDFIVFSTATLLPLAVAIVAFCLTEGWSIGESAFVALACATGLGLADTAPVTKGGKIALSFYLFVNMGVTLNACSLLGHMVSSGRVSSSAPLSTLYSAVHPSTPVSTTQMISALNKNGARAKHTEDDES